VNDIETRAKLALQGARVDWRQTPIANWSGGIVGEAERIAGPSWWKKSEPREADGREIIRLVERAGLGTLRMRDDENIHTASQVVEHQHNKQKNLNESASKNRKEHADDELEPTESETIADWFGRLSTAVDVRGAKKLPFDVLRSYASRFRGDSPARRTLDAKLVAEFLKQVR
jgi:hypothetical protein